MPTPQSTDCLVVGGGVVGLSIAYQLAGDGLSVRVVEQGETGRQASWAGAGILPPGSWFSSHTDVEALAALSHGLQTEWSASLKEESGVDDEFEVCGALYAITPDVPVEAVRHLEERLDAWRPLGFESRRVAADEAAELEPGLIGVDAYLVPDEAQLRNPRRLEALRKACVMRGVLMETGSGVEDFRTEASRITSVVTSKGEFVAADYCLAAGAWTGQLGERLGISVPTTPIRGQMALLRTPRRELQRVFHRGGNYLVPRRDGRVLVGATVEEAGFDTSTLPADIDHLVRFAHDVAPCLAEAQLETSWAGLRPASGDGLPMIGRLPNLTNGWIAGGHFRSGLQFAPATAVLISQLLRGVHTSLDISAFDPARFSAAIRVDS